MYDITINTFLFLGMILSSGITGAVLAFGLKSIDKEFKETTVINPNWKQRIKECDEVESIMGLMEKRKYKLSKERLKKLHKKLLDS